MATEPTRYIEDDEISIKEVILNIQGWFKYLWSKGLILLIAGFVGASFGFFYSFLREPVYTAKTTFVLESGGNKSSLSSYAGIAAMAGIDLGSDAGGLFQGDNILELYKSRTMLAQTLLTKVHPDSNELLIERYIDYNKMEEGWKDRQDLLMLDFRQNPSELSPKDLRARDSIITRIVNAINEDVLTVDKPEKTLSIIQVEVTSPDEVFSKVFNESLVRRVNDFYVQTKTKRSGDNISILEAKVDSVRAVMEGAIYSAARVSDATPNLNPTRQAQRVGPTQEAQFLAESNKSMLAQLLQNLEIAKMNQLQEQPLIQLVDQPVYPLKVNGIGKLKGLILGGLACVFLVTFCLIVRKWYCDIMASREY